MALGFELVADGCAPLGSRLIRPHVTCGDVFIRRTASRAMMCRTIAGANRE
jgi:hypothetical protein